MNILIIGCGKVGAGLANSLYKAGHDVAVVDNHAENFSRLEDAFTGFAVTGVPIDLDVLQQAGIEACDFVAAVTDDDNTNVMVSQLAKEFFNVPKVLTRIYDPRRKDVFAQFGLHTISPTALTVNIIEKIINGDEDLTTHQLSFGSTTLNIDSLPVPKAYYGVALRDVDHDESETIIGVQPANGSMILWDKGGHYCLQPGDQLVFAKII
ncbi:MAG: TrkA family potassium uptake protein [Angelakisella sp.]